MTYVDSPCRREEKIRCAPELGIDKYYNVKSAPCEEVVGTGCGKECQGGACIADGEAQTCQAGKVCHYNANHISECMDPSLIKYDTRPPVVDSYINPAFHDSGTAETSDVGYCAKSDEFLYDDQKCDEFVGCEQKGDNLCYKRCQSNADCDQLERPYCSKLGLYENTTLNCAKTVMICRDKSTDDICL